MSNTYFAQVYEGVVNSVICATQEFIDHYDDPLPGVWLLTDYYTYGNKHYGADGYPDGGTPFRGNYAGVGFIYDQTNDVFYAPQPYKNAVLNTSTWLWEQPVESLPTITNTTTIINGVEIEYLPPTVLPVGGIVGWKYYAESSYGIFEQTLPNNAYPFIITGLEGGVVYTINIGCTDTNGNTYWTVNPAELIPLTALPPAITSATPENASATITWATAPNQDDILPPVEGQVFWKIGYKPESSSGDYTWVDSTNHEETYTLTGLTNGTKYAVSVIDVVNSNESEPSQPFYVTPAA